MGDTLVSISARLLPATMRTLLLASVKLFCTAPATRTCLAISSRFSIAPARPPGPMLMTPAPVLSTTLRCSWPAPVVKSLNDTCPVLSATLPVLVNEPPSTVMPLGLAMITLARGPSTAMLPWIRDGSVLVTWLTMVRARTVALFRSAPAVPTLNEV